MKNTKKMLEDALLNGYCVPQFNINNLEWTKYILEECQENESPVILGVSEGAMSYMGGPKTVVNMTKGLIEDLNIKIDVALHLDHATSFESCKKAIDAGFTSVMIDASKFELNENIIITKQVVKYAHERNVTVEAEIGAIGGQEDNITSEIEFAKTKDALELVEKTRIDSLAPALGSIHGIYKDKPNLNFVRMKEISEKTKIPLVLHGGTGITKELIERAITCGTSKIEY